MSISTTKLHLEATQQRRLGLTRGNYKHGHLLQSLNASAYNALAPVPMAPQTAAKRLADVEKFPAKGESDEDIARQPDSDSDSDDRSDLKETNFQAGSSKPGEPPTQTKLSPARKGRAVANGGTGNKTAGTRKGTRSTDVVQSSSESSVASSSTKRKGEEQSTKLGAGVTDQFGNIKRPAKKPKNVYGQKNPRIYVKPKPKPKEKLTVYEPMEDSPQKSDSSNRLKVLPDIDSSPECTPKQASKIRQRADPAFTPTPTKNERTSLKKYDLDDLSDSDDDTAKQGLKKLRLPQLDESPAKKTEGMKSYTLDLGADLLSTARLIIDEDRDELAPASQDMEDYDFQSMTQRACCPMCGAIVNPDDIRAYSKNGVMNIRTQEKFCRAHKIKTAQDDWEIKSYPVIDWDKLDTRISKHHTFIKKLINGQNSHYRELWDDTVTAGNDRSLMKMTSNLTPGYYGARGLRIFSENIMHNFTPLLKRRAPQDSLISARGIAAFVQSVLVPEVTVRLIMEDVQVDVEESRQILADSVELGELLNEEIGDVVTKKVADSEDEDESD